MTTPQRNSIETHDFAMPSYTNNQDDQDMTSSSSDSTPSQTPTQELSTSMMESSLAKADTSRGRPRYRRRQQSKRYFTPPSRIQSPARPDYMLEVESAPQDPDIFADAETDYFSSADKNDGPRAYRRHFFDAMPSIDGQASNDMMNLNINNHSNKIQSTTQ